MAQDVRSNSLLQATPSCDELKQQAIQRLTTWMTIEGVPGLSAALLESLQQEHQVSPQQLCKMKSSELVNLGFSAKQVLAITASDNRDILRAIEWVGNNNLRSVIDYAHPNYPQLLKQLSRPPFVLFCEGNLELLNQPQLSIVGSRNPSHYGADCAFSFAQQVAQSGIGVTSGLAIGIDAQAHRGALSAGGGTIGVLGSGLGCFYPKRNEPLAREMVEKNGLLMSEFAPFTPPRAANFPRRNRIVSGLSQAVFIVEAAIKSGSLITARCALEQNREVLALPGNIHNPLCQGAHYLIQQGAKLVNSITDILEEFQNVNSYLAQSMQKNIQKSPEESLATDRLLDSVDYDVTALDVIIQRSQLAVNEVLAQLLEYELRGLVTSVSGGYIKLRGK